MKPPRARYALESKLGSLTDAVYVTSVVDEIAHLSEEATAAARTAESLVQGPPPDAGRIGCDRLRPFPCSTMAPAQDISTGKAGGNLRVWCGPALASAGNSMNPSESLRDVIGRGVELTACEAVAVAQQLIASADVGLCRPPSLDQVCLGADGSIAYRQCLRPLSVSEIGRLLAEMLPHEGTTPVSGALRYTIARALSEVEAPPFDSLGDLSAALARHEQRDPVAVVGELYARAESKPTERAGSPVDRRRRTPSTATLRRQLHEADEALFSHLHRTEPGAPQPSPGPTAVDPFILLPESAYVAAAGDGFDPARWAIGATVALLVSFGAGYASMAGVRATKVASPAVQGAASAATTVDDASRGRAMPDRMPARGTARQSDERPAPPPRQSP